MKVLIVRSAADTVTLARPSPLRLVPPRPRQGEPALSRATKSAIANEIRYLGIRLTAPLIILAVFVLCLLPSIREELVEHGWPRGTFKWLVSAILAMIAFLSQSLGKL